MTSNSIIYKVITRAYSSGFWLATKTRRYGDATALG